MLGFIFGFAVGVGLMHFLGSNDDDDDGDYSVIQSGNIASGDIVGRDKTTSVA